TVVEPMAAGKPVVGGDIAGYRGVMTPGVHGLLVEPRDPQALALALVRVLADRELQQRMGAAGMEAAQQHAWPRVAAGVLEVYRESAEHARHAAWRQEFR